MARYFKIIEIDRDSFVEATEEDLDCCQLVVPSLGECLCADIVEEGWCKFQVRTDWEDMEGERHGWYVVEKAPHNSPIFRGKRGWFPVWIIRLGEWY